MEKNNKIKKKKCQLALNCTIGSLAILGSVGTITFGTLWCQSRNNGGNTPTDDSTVAWTHNISVKPIETYENWYLDFSKYDSPIEPLARQEYASSADATRAYYDAISNNYKIFSNDVLCNMIINFFEVVDNQDPTTGEGEYRMLFPNPQTVIDSYYSGESWHQGWTSSNFQGIANMSCKTDEISWDDEHNCIRVSSTSTMSLAFSYTLSDPDGEDDPITEHGTIAFYQSSKSIPFELGYGEEYIEWSIDGRYLSDAWFSFMPDDFYFVDGNEGWAYEDDNWSVDYNFMANAIDSSSPGTIIPIENTYVGFGIPGHYDKNAISGIPYGNLMSTIPDRILSLGQNSTNGGINYMQNSAVV